MVAGPLAIVRADTIASGPATIDPPRRDPSSDHGTLYRSPRIPFSTTNNKITMLLTPQTLPLIALVAAALTLSLSLPPTSPTHLIPTSHLTLPPPPPPPNNNKTTPPPLLAYKWPPTPFERHLAQHTSLLVLHLAPSSLAPQSSILADIRLLSVRARAAGPGLALIQRWHDVSGPVEFWFRAADELFMGADVAALLDAIAEMTNVYGAAGIRGVLVKGEGEGEGETAAFEVALRVGVDGAVG